MLSRRLSSPWIVSQCSICPATNHASLAQVDLAIIPQIMVSAALFLAQCLHLDAFGTRDEASFQSMDCWSGQHGDPWIGQCEDCDPVTIFRFKLKFASKIQSIIVSLDDTPCVGQSIVHLTMNWHVV